MTYRQHLACITGGHWPDIYHLGRGSMNIVQRKGISLFDKEMTIPYHEIAYATTRKSLLGWIFRYRTLLIFNDGRELEFKYIPLAMIKELQTKIDNESKK
jgi:hypothetical protein